MYDDLTQKDIKDMEAEVEHRKLVIRPKTLEDVREARAHGDLSENFEYHAAKREKNQNESRIRYLEKMIKTAQIIDDSSKEDEVGINNTVTVLFEEDGEEEKYRLVTTVRTDCLNGLISIESPLGKAILGKKVGERAEVRVNENSAYHVVIKEIDNTTDDSQDRINQF